MQALLLLAYIMALVLLAQLTAAKHFIHSRLRDTSDESHQEFKCYDMKGYPPYPVRMKCP